MTRKRTTARNKSNGKTRQEESYGVEFVSIELSPEDKAHLREWVVPPEELWQELERLADNGYKVSLSVDMANTGGIVAVTGKRGCVPETNENRCLVSRGPTLEGAMLSTLYKLQAYCMDGHFPDAITPRDSDFS
jgi:hypothetical protein